MVSSPLAVVLAGGRGSRLHELTAATCKPAVPFAGSHRIVDWTMSNLARSSVDHVAIALQYRPERLARHLKRRWGSDFSGRNLTMVNGLDAAGTPQGFNGTADALRCILSGASQGTHREVLALGADHIYEMDYDAMLATHRATAAMATVATYRVPRDTAHEFGVVATDPSGRVTAFIEKPSDPPGLPDDLASTQVSMGIYVFDHDWLHETLTRHADLMDIGHDLLPLAQAQGSLFAVQAARADDRAFYWRDVGSLDAYRDAHLDFRGVPPCAVPSGPVPLQSRLSGIDRGNVVMPGAWASQKARLSRTIVATGARVQDGMVIGEDPEEDARWFRITPGGTRLVTAAMLARHTQNRVRLYALASLRRDARTRLEILK